ncbi:MAG: hypothetical protein HN348_00095 [Proteobacteria bacterium]|nr:hypothetical protein [Pseudomonadota bacterium]
MGSLLESPIVGLGRRGLLAAWLLHWIVWFGILLAGVDFGVERVYGIVVMEQTG